MGHTLPRIKPIKENSTAVGHTLLSSSPPAAVPFACSTLPSPTAVGGRRHAVPIHRHHRRRRCRHLQPRPQPQPPHPQPQPPHPQPLPPHPSPPHLLPLLPPPGPPAAAALGTHPLPLPSATASTALRVADIEERLAGVPVYALANAAQEFVLVSSAREGGGQEGGGARPPPALGLLCFRKEDADALLEQMEGDMRAGSSVVPVALNKVIQLKSDGVAFRFLPDSSQVANAIKLMQDEGLYAREGFPGVPVFQEDLDNSLYRTARDQQKPNPAVRLGDTQVSSLEGIIKSMKDSSSSKWDDVVFIPPGFDLATGSKPSHLNKYIFL